MRLIPYPTRNPAPPPPAFPRPRQTHLWLPDGPATVPVFYRPELPRDFSCRGPALITEDFATTLLWPGFEARVAPGDHLVLEDQR